MLCIISVSRYVYGNAAMTIKELFSPVIRHAELGLNMVMPYALPRRNPHSRHVIRILQFAPVFRSILTYSFHGEQVCVGHISAGEGTDGKGCGGRNGLLRGSKMTDW